MRCLVIAVRWLCTNFIYTHFFQQLTIRSVHPYSTFKTKKNPTEKRSVLIFNVHLQQCSQRLTFCIRCLTKHLTKITFDQHCQLLQLQEFSKRSKRLLISPAPPVSHLFHVHLKEIFPKDSSWCFSSGSLDHSSAVCSRSGLNHQLCCCYSLKDVQGDVGARGWSLWLTPETCFWPGRKWRPLACRHGS